MKDVLTNKVNLFIKNSEIMRQEFKWEYRTLQILSALLYSQENKIVEPSKIREGKQIIKENTSMFSQFKGTNNIIISTYLALAVNPEQVFKDTLQVYERMKEQKFTASDYLVVAAFNIANQCDKYDHERVIEKTKIFFQAMKENHRFLTGQDDYIYASMIGISDLEVTTSSEKVECIFRQLKLHFSSGNGVQALSNILLLSKNDYEKDIEKTVLIYNNLKAKKFKLSNENMLASLGIIALVANDNDDINVIIEEIVETYEYIYKQKGFGNFSITKDERILFAVSLVISTRVNEIAQGTLKTSLATSITNILIAQQTALIATSSAAAVAAANSASK